MKIDEYEFNKIEIDEEVISNYTNESQFMIICVELFKVIINITNFVASINQNNNYLEEQEGWTRNEAIIKGLLIRLIKLMMSFLEDTCNNKREIMDIIIRCMFETIINLNYLIKHKSEEEVFDDYILSSLSIEKKLYDRIQLTIKHRGDILLPIEERILSAIENSFIDSGYNVTDGNLNKKFKKIIHKANDVFSEQSYLYFISLPSHFIHGNWQDLLIHHLTYKDGKFFPKSHWSVSRPQNLTTISFLIIEFLIFYIKTELPDCYEKEFLLEQLIYHMELNKKIKNMHESFLCSRKDYSKYMEEK